MLKITLNNDVKKVMFAEAMSIATKILMNNNLYEFNDEVFLQEDEGGIGVEYTGIISEIAMLKWNKNLKEKLKRLKFTNELQERLIDDITVLPTLVEPGTEFENDELVIKENKLSLASDKPQIGFMI